MTVVWPPPADRKRIGALLRGQRREALRDYRTGWIPPTRTGASPPWAPPCEVALDWYADAEDDELVQVCAALCSDCPAIAICRQYAAVADDGVHGGLVAAGIVRRREQDRERQRRHRARSRATADPARAA